MAQSAGHKRPSPDLSKRAKNARRRATQYHVAESAPQDEAVGGQEHDRGQAAHLEPVDLSSVEGAKMSRMNGLAVLAASRMGSLRALWARIDAGKFPPPIVNSTGFGFMWDSAAVMRAIAIVPAPEPEKREQPQPKTTTRERKDDPRIETRESE